jgi:hypothetical protein
MNRNNENSKAAGGGIGFCGLLAIAFIVLKLTGVIGWSWGWVLAPLWIPAAIVGVIMVIILIVMIAKVVGDELKKR